LSKSIHFAFFEKLKGRRSIAIPWGASKDQNSLFYELLKKNIFLQVFTSFVTFW